ncbi:MAG: hypothetical protein HY900_13235 [Deltaproteobacteria bacterium]|nr:hypothetical protein [Deltaproteobacteria bacterium]
MKVRVECYAGFRGEETPRRLLFGTRSLEVSDVVDRWLAPDHRYFKVIGEDGCIYIIRHDVEADEWELTSFDCRKG